MLKCSGCGSLAVSSPVTADGEGHHVLPGDEENDWICRGRWVEVDRVTARAPLRSKLIADGVAATAQRCADLKEAHDVQKRGLLGAVATVKE